MKSAVFWGITRPRVVIVYWRFGTTYRSHLHGWTVRPVKMGPIRCPEKSVKKITTRRRVIPKNTADFMWIPTFVIQVLEAALSLSTDHEQRDTAQPTQATQSTQSTQFTQLSDVCRSLKPSTVSVSCKCNLTFFSLRHAQSHIACCTTTRTTSHTKSRLVCTLRPAKQTRRQDVATHVTVVGVIVITRHSRCPDRLFCFTRQIRLVDRACDDRPLLLLGGELSTVRFLLVNSLF